MKKFLFFLFPFIFLAGCTHRIKHSSLMAISLGMNKEQVIRRLGHPAIFRGSVVNKFDQIVEVLEYTVDRGLSNKQVVAAIMLVALTWGLIIPFLFFVEGKIETFWLYFHDGKLVQWGRAGDWGQEVNAVYEVRFR